MKTCEKWTFLENYSRNPLYIFIAFHNQVMLPCEFFFFNSKIIWKHRFEYYIEINSIELLKSYQKRNFKGDSNSGKITGVRVLNAIVGFLKREFTFLPCSFCLSKKIFSIDYFSFHLIHFTSENLWKWILSITFLTKLNSIKQFGMVLFLSSIVYQSSWVILCESLPNRRTALIIFNPFLATESL